MKNLLKYTILALLVTGLFSCEDLFEPVDDNRLTPDYVESDPESAEGLLLHAYTGLISHTNFTVIATDDAVTNNLNDDYTRMATGQLSAQFNPMQRWDFYNEIFYINKFIGVLESDKVIWNQNDTVNSLFEERLMGEALAMRAIYHFYILQAHAGVSVSGQLLGIPYYEEYLTIDDNFNLPRLSFEETVNKIIADLDAAIALLPTYYSDDEGDVLPKHQGYDFEHYIVVNGEQYQQRISGLIAEALKARIELFAASPSYLDGAGHYENAAGYAAALINMNGGISGLTSRIDFYTSDSRLKGAELLWRSTIEHTASYWLEENNYPPSVNGNGDINPSHNLVSAFPMENGYPATETNGYDPQNPYENRDPRLKAFIVCNDNSIYTGANIITGVGGGINRIDSISERSTRTGYYLKKLLRAEGVRINDDGTVTAKKHIDIYMRYTELYLILAEAANEIGGPDYAVEGITARDVIAAIRERADIAQPDDYLASITSKEDMRTLIQNERRIELCFEGHRFWDLRRWGLPLDESVSGYFHNGSGYVEIPVVETRNYPAYAKYLPIPNDEILKFSALEQNQGW